MIKTNDIVILLGSILVLSYLNRKTIASGTNTIINEITGTANSFKYKDIFRAAESANSLPAGLLEKMAETESNFNVNAISPAGAIGIMQIIPKWHPSVNPFDPIASINYAGKFIRSLFNEFGSWDLALAGYNWGSGNLKKFGIQNAPTETKNYIKKILYS